MLAPLPPNPNVFFEELKKEAEKLGLNELVERWPIADGTWDLFIHQFEDALDLAVSDMTRIDQDMTRRLAKEWVWKRLKAWMGER